MKKINKEKILAFADSVLVLSWGILLCTIGREGPLAALLHPAFHLSCLVGGITLLILALALSFFPMRPHQSTLSVLVVQRLILLIPLLLAPTIRPEGLSRTALMNRGLAGQTHMPLLPKKTNSQIYQDSDGLWHITPLDAWIISKSHLERQDFSNADVSLIGQLFLPGNNSPSAETRLFRLWVNCCVADATPVAITIINFDPSSYHTTGDLSWIQAKGRLHFCETPPHTPSLEITDWRPAAVPTERYIFR